MQEIESTMHQVGMVWVFPANIKFNLHLFCTEKYAELVQ